MNVTAVAIIGIIFGSIYAVVNAILKHLKESKKMKTGDDSTQQEIQNLKERVATLERIVTDDKYQLNKEFDSLK